MTDGKKTAREKDKTVNGYGHLALNVSDMDRAVAFYCDVLGFENAFELPHPETGKRWITYLYAHRGQWLELFVGGENRIEYRKDNIGFSHICLETEDLAATGKRILDAGWTLDRPVEKGCDGNDQCWIHDPDGNRIELMQIFPDSLQSRFLKEHGSGTGRETRQ